MVFRPRTPSGTDKYFLQQTDAAWNHAVAELQARFYLLTETTVLLEEHAHGQSSEGIKLQTQLTDLQATVLRTMTTLRADLAGFLGAAATGPKPSSTSTSTPAFCAHFLARSIRCCNKLTTLPKRLNKNQVKSFSYNYFFILVARIHR